MDATTLQHFLGWGVVAHYAVLLLWFAVFVFARAWLYRLHGRFFPNITALAFDAIHYAAMAFYKVMVLLFWLVPWLLLAAG